MRTNTSIDVITVSAPADGDLETTGDRALERLRSVCDQILRLERESQDRPAELLHSTAAGLHLFAAAVATCEKEGLPRAAVADTVWPLRTLHATSPFVHRLQTWPRGYAGDFETVEWLCDATNRAVPGTVGWAIEQYALQSPIAQQHRNKIGVQARVILATVLHNRAARILSVGYGGCRDLGLIQSCLPSGAGRFVLVDSDAEALEFAQERLHALRDRCHAVHGRVPRVLPSLAEYGFFDLIVAGGLFDYLPDRWAVASLREMRKLLAPGGRLLLSNIAVGNPFRPWLEYLAEWRLIERDRDDMKRLLADAGLPASAAVIFSDSTGLALFSDLTTDAEDRRHPAGESI